ncbi:hypothetical protein MNV_480024 [Candidatus Methanoperedens nitroreducens]|uniref:Uncharacterized protein n=1 Tax=Candidatus Methanoperedens nitratireducens TaxID=1392998 RepID=A0A284VR99_9EURY|nr:hypothetical protein MNV_480024 [Candidatus Methanoperedens nitroreducens]
MVGIKVKYQVCALPLLLLHRPCAGIFVIRSRMIHMRRDHTPQIFKRLAFRGKSLVAAHHNLRQLVKKDKTPFAPGKLRGQNEGGSLVVIPEPFLEELLCPEVHEVLYIVLYT